MKTKKIINENIQIAALKLFHCIVEENDTESIQVEFPYLIEYGILPIDSNGKLVKTMSRRLADLIVDTLGFKAIEWSSSFHKSWDKVATADIESLIAEQIINYASTYGAEIMGFKSINLVPVEKILMDMDSLPANESFKIINVIDVDNLRDKFVDYLSTTKAPHKDMIEHIRVLLNFVGNCVEIDDIKSFEIKIMFCDINSLVPIDGQDFLRYMIYRMTGSPLLIKDRATIELIKRNCYKDEFVRAFEDANLTSLAESFYRFKPLYLAFKHNKRIAPIINKIRRLAVKYHKPVTGFAVANVVDLISQSRRDDAFKIINKADMRELIKLWNFANAELELSDHVYNIRNGKVFVRESEDNNESLLRRKNIIYLKTKVSDTIIERLDGVYKDKVFYIPEGIEYVAPVSEKQMYDVLPYGTKIHIPEDATALCIGGHWFNDENRIDLDFHLTSKYGSYGWNSSYRSANKDILFSGDMTDAPAPLGAVEAYRIDANVKTPYELSVNVYNINKRVPFDLLFTKDITDKCNFRKNDESMISAVIEPKNAIAPVLKLRTDEKQSVIGFYNNRAFTIYGGGIGGGHSVPNRDLMVKALDAFVIKTDAMMALKSFIIAGGGKIVNSLEDGCIDLSPNNITQTSLFDIIDCTLAE